MENTSGYSYGMLKAWSKLFCKTCGVFIGRWPLPIPAEVVPHIPEMARSWTIDAQHLRAVNLRLLNDPDLDMSQLKISRVDGYNGIPIPYHNP